MSRINELALQFSIQLQHYLTNPSSKLCRTKLISAACKLFKEAVKSSNLEPDQYLTVLDNALKDPLQVVMINQKQGNQLDEFNRQLANSDDDSHPLAFHVLTLAYHNHLKKRQTATEESNFGNLPEIDEDELYISEFMLI